MSIMKYLNPFNHHADCAWSHPGNDEDGYTKQGSKPCTCGCVPWDQPGIPAPKTEEEWKERQANPIKIENNMSHCGLIKTSSIEETESGAIIGETLHHPDCAVRLYWKLEDRALACNCEKIRLAEKAHRNCQILAVIEMIFEHENETNENERLNIRETIDRILKGA